MGGGGGAFPAGLGGGGGGVFPFAAGGGGVLAAGLDGDAALGASLVAAFLVSYAFVAVVVAAGVTAGASSFFFGCLLWLITVVSGKISVTTPAAMVFPPSLNANLDPFEIVNGKWSFPLIVTLSPGLAILVLSGN